MPAETRPRSLRAALLIAGPLSLVIGLAWYFRWLVIEGYPPLRITSVALGVLGALGIGIGIRLRRALRTMHARGGSAATPPPRPTARDWIVSALYGLLVLPLTMGPQTVAITFVPLVAVAALAFAGDVALLACRAPDPRSVAAGALAASGVLALGLGPDGGNVPLLALVVAAPAVKALGRAGVRAALTAPPNEVASVGFVVAALVLQVAGIWRGEEFDGMPVPATLAIFGQLAVVAAIIGIVALAGARTHPGIVRRASAGGLVAVGVVGHAACDQTIGDATVIALVLVVAAILLNPPTLDERP